MVCMRYQNCNSLEPYNATQALLILGVAKPPQDRKTSFHPPEEHKHVYRI
jgi:hypothetical protein